MRRRRQLDLFPDTIRPRTYLWRMHVADAGQGMILFACQRCGHQSGWIPDEWSITANRRGRPCPVCNMTSAASLVARHEPTKEGRVLAATEAAGGAAAAASN